MTYASDPSGAQVYCNGISQGYTPVTRYFLLDKETKARGVVTTIPCDVKWVSGASARANREFSLSQFPNGVTTTVTRPRGEGHSQDAEFALKVRSVKASERAANAAQQQSNTTTYRNNNTVNCKKMGEFLKVEIKTFSGTLCPLGWYKAY